MVCRQRYIGGRFCGVMLAAAVVAGCTSPRPAPVVNRTDLPLPGAESQSPIATMPGQQPGGYPGESSPSGRVDPNLKTSPKGLKRPYGEPPAVDAAVNPIYRGPGAAGVGAAGVPANPGVGGAGSAGAGAGTAAVTAVPAPAVVATTVSPSATAAAGVPPLTRPAIPPASGSAGLLDGVAFGWPAAGTVLQNFDQTSSKGLALGGKAGDVVRSAADGRVIFSGTGPRGYGNLVIVKHDSELLSVYAHNRSLAVKEGDSVKRGQKIAELGNSGTDTPKLHFEIRQQGKPIDPLAVLPRR